MNEHGKKLFEGAVEGGDPGRGEAVVRATASNRPCR